MKPLKVIEKSWEKISDFDYEEEKTFEKRMAHRDKRGKETSAEGKTVRRSSSYRRYFVRTHRNTAPVISYVRGNIHNKQIFNDNLVEDYSFHKYFYYQEPVKNMIWIDDVSKEALQELWKEYFSVDSAKMVKNFMAGVSYKIEPFDTMKMVTASSIFGEPQYYRDGINHQATILDGTYEIDRLFLNYSLRVMDSYVNMKTSDLIEQVIKKALDYDYMATLEWAVQLRNEFFMRLNPQIIMVMAALHPKRVEFTQKHPGEFDRINQQVMRRGDDVIAQFQYYLFKNHGKKNHIPNILKRSWAKKISSMSRYELYKYRNAGVGLINVIRVCHAKGADIDELLRTKSVVMQEEDLTWEHLRANGKSWSEITATITMNHMALLRNLRGICLEIADEQKVQQLLNHLKGGVKKGKQFPFRYLNAYCMIQSSYEMPDSMKKTMLDALEQCMDISCQNLPKLAGSNAFLSDNSGSAWGACPSEYGRVTVAEIGNLSAVIGAANSDEGYVYKFGNTMKRYHVQKEQILQQAYEISSDQYSDVGGHTENGIWMFFQYSITQKIHWDNIFIYSDMQAGHGGLYGMDEIIDYGDGDAHIHSYIDVAKLIIIYRKLVNSKVNVYCIQTAGYDNVLVPEYGYRTNILYGWTGKELLFADAMNRFWDEKDANWSGEKRG